MDRDFVINRLGQADFVELPAIPAVSRDPKDDKFLATARAGRVDYLVTEDRDLLDLVEYEGTKIITTEEFLRVLEEPGSQAA
jgi:predicted nucleic acid-binding protein